MRSFEHEKDSFALKRSALPLLVVVLEFCCWAAPRAAWAQEEPSISPATAPLPDSAFTGDGGATNRGRWTVLPIIFSSPNTGFAGGVLPQYVFRSSPASRPSNVRLDAYYTQQRQFHIQVTSQLWLHNDGWRLTGKVALKNWPTTYYGIGRMSSALDRESYTERLASLSMTVQREIRPRFYLGAGYILRTSAIRPEDLDGALASSTVTGANGGLASGLGAKASWDTRDNVYFPTSGSLHELSVEAFERALGSDYRFASYSLDMRRYLSYSKHVMALRAHAGFMAGGPPFRMFRGIGDLVRGYAAARYVDRNVLALQAEYRIVPIWRRVGFALFGGIGDVAPTPTSFRLDEMRYAFGGGLRFQLSRREKINVRWDYAVGRGSSGDYLDLNEAY